MPTKKCPVCGMTEDQWVYDDGKGHQGKYCCPGCAKGTGCKCRTTEVAHGKSQAKTSERRASQE